jgi:hypothetical protein
LQNEVFPDGNEFVLIMNIYSAYRYDQVKALASQLSIKLVFNSSGCTKTCQLFGSRIFGILKSGAPSLWRRYDHPTKGAQGSPV